MPPLLQLVLIQRNSFWKVRLFLFFFFFSPSNSLSLSLSVFLSFSSSSEMNHQSSPLSPLSSSSSSSSRMSFFSSTGVHAITSHDLKHTFGIDRRRVVIDPPTAAITSSSDTILSNAPPSAILVTGVMLTFGRNERDAHPQDEEDVCMLFPHVHRRVTLSFKGSLDVAAAGAGAAGDRFSFIAQMIRKHPARFIELVQKHAGVGIHHHHGEFGKYPQTHTHTHVLPTNV
jgi:hypothetical protein